MNREGWICTRCGASLSPDVQRCTCAPTLQPVPYTPFDPYTVPSGPIWIDPTLVPTYPNPHPQWGWQITSTAADRVVIKTTTS